MTLKWEPIPSALMDLTQAEGKLIEAAQMTKDLALAAKLERAAHFVNQAMTLAREAQDAAHPTQQKERA